MTPAEIGGLVLGSAVIAAVIAGLFSRSTTHALIADQRDERRITDERIEKDRQQALLSADTQRFIERYVAGGLESVAWQLDRASQHVDLSHRRAKRLRAMVRRNDRPPDSLGTFRDLIEIRGILDPPVVDPIVINQALLVPFPGAFMQSGLMLNRCLALADDWCQRYPWTQDAKLERVELFLTEAKTVLAASARRYETAAFIARGHGELPYASWFPATLNDQSLVDLGQQLETMVDGLLGGDAATSLFRDADAVQEDQT